VRILMSGAGGLIGAALAPRLAALGHTVTRLVRSAPSVAGEFRWDPVAGTVDPAAWVGCDAVIHLAGSSIAAGRWSAGRKLEILESRRLGTRLIASSIARAALASRGSTRGAPGVLISASGVGFYGDRGDEVLDEGSAAGAGFLAEVVRVWEGEAKVAGEAGVRVVHPRFGVVLASGGGALPRLALPFRLGLGGPVGSGRQWVSWVAIEDALGAMVYALSRNDLSGPVNVVSPQPVTQTELSQVMGRVLHRPAFLRIPSGLVRVALGEMGRELLLFSQRAMPGLLTASGFAFDHPGIEGALRHVFEPSR
jgi:uncharacterized protein